MKKKTSLLSLDVYLNMCRHRLQKNQRRFAKQWPHRTQHQSDQQHRQCRIHIVFVLPIGQPHNQRTDDHNYTAQSIAQHMQIDSAHVHLRRSASTTVTVTVAMSGSGLLDDRLFGLRVVHERIVFVVVGAAGELGQFFVGCVG